MSIRMQKPKALFDCLTNASSANSKEESIKISILGVENKNQRYLSDDETATCISFSNVFLKQVD